MCVTIFKRCLNFNGKSSFETRQCSFTWTGPYGSGKSSLLVVLGALLSGDAKLRAKAGEIVGDDISNDFWSKIPPKKKGWHVIGVVGSRDNPKTEIINSINLYQGNPTHNSSVSDRDVIKKLKDLYSLKDENFGGVILFIDEMGKFLERAVQDRSTFISFSKWLK